MDTDRNILLLMRALYTTGEEEYRYLSKSSFFAFHLFFLHFHLLAYYYSKSTE